MSVDRDTLLLQAAVARGLLTSADARTCLEFARRTGTSAAAVLVQRGLIEQRGVQDMMATLQPPPSGPALAPPGQATWWDQGAPGEGRPVDPAAATSAHVVSQTALVPPGPASHTALVPPAGVPGPAPRVFGAPGRGAIVPGTVLGGDWEVIEALGAGGMGAVYRARQLSLGREVALKVLPPEAGGANATERFLREARSAAAVSHPNVITVFAAGRDEASGRLFLAMELVRGGDADALAKKSGGRLPERRALEIARDVARGLTALEAAGLVHRDIKPANMFLAPDGTAKLADLGLARGLADRMTETGAVVGTPAFMSPEQAQGTQGELDIGTDIYAVGASLYALLTGKPPFEGGSVLALLKKVLDDPAPDPRVEAPTVSATTAAIVARAMAKKRSSRYATAAELVADLERALTGLERSASGGAASRVVPGLGLALAAVVVAGAAVVALGVGGGAPGPGGQTSTSTDGAGSAAARETKPEATTETQTAHGSTQTLDPPTAVTKAPESRTETAPGTPSSPDVATPTPTVVTWSCQGETPDDLQITHGELTSLAKGGQLVLWKPGDSKLTARFAIKGAPTWVHLRMGHLGTKQDGVANCFVNIEVNGRPILFNDAPRRPQWFDLTGIAHTGENELTITLHPRSTTHYWLEWIQLHHGVGLPPASHDPHRVDR